MESSDGVQGWAFHLIEELTCVAREALKVLSLAFGEEGIECEGAFSATAYSGDNDEFSARQVEIDGSEVMGTGTADFDVGGLRQGGF